MGALCLALLTIGPWTGLVLAMIRIVWAFGRRDLRVQGQTWQPSSGDLDLARRSAYQAAIGCFVAVVAGVILLARPEPPPRLVLGTWLFVPGPQGIAITWGLDPSWMGLCWSTIAAGTGVLVCWWSLADEDGSAIAAAPWIAAIAGMSIAFYLASNLAQMLWWYGLLSVAVFLAIAGPTAFATGARTTGSTPHGGALPSGASAQRQSAAARKLWLTALCGDALLMLIVVWTAVVLKSWDRSVLSSPAMSKLLDREPALCALTGLGLVAGIVARCGLFPGWSWQRDVGAWPAPLRLLVWLIGWGPPALFWCFLFSRLLTGPAVPSIVNFGCAAYFMAGLASFYQTDRQRVWGLLASAQLVLLLIAVCQLAPANQIPTATQTKPAETTAIEAAAAEADGADHASAADDHADQEQKVLEPVWPVNFARPSALLEETLPWSVRLSLCWGAYAAALILQQLFVGRHAEPTRGSTLASLLVVGGLPCGSFLIFIELCTPLIEQVLSGTGGRGLNAEEGASADVAPLAIQLMSLVVGQILLIAAAINSSGRSPLQSFSTEFAADRNHSEGVVPSRVRGRAIVVVGLLAVIAVTSVVTIGSLLQQSTAERAMMAAVLATLLPIGWILGAPVKGTARSPALPESQLARMFLDLFHTEQLAFFCIDVPLRAGAQLVRFLDWFAVTGALTTLTRRLPDRVAEECRELEARGSQWAWLLPLLATGLLLATITWWSP